MAGKPVGGGEDGAEVIGGMAPLRGEPSVVEVEPTDHRAEVEGRANGIEFKAGPGHARAEGHGEPGYDRTQELRTRRVLQRHDAAAQRIEQTVGRGIKRLVAGDGRVQRVIGELDKEPVRCRANVGNGRGHQAGARWLRGGTGRLAGPMYWAPGRMILLSSRCSMRWAVQPAIRANTNSGVKIFTGTPSW